MSLSEEEEVERVEEGEEAEERVEELEEIVLERFYTIPLGRAWLAPRKKRVPRAVRMIKEFMLRHMKAKEVKLDEDLNEFLWRRGIENPPRRVRVRATKDKEDIVKVYLAS
jgi:large subunit ribosomal protein L31e